ncbi:hypothetical protein ACHAXS_000920 [Conticribra weissflogii]
MNQSKIHPAIPDNGAMSTSMGGATDNIQTRSENMGTTSNSQADGSSRRGDNSGSVNNSPPHSSTSGRTTDPFHDVSPNHRQTRQSSGGSGGGSSSSSCSNSTSSLEENDQEFPIQVSEPSFGDDEKFSYFDAMEVLYFDDMLEPQHPSQSLSNSVGSSSSSPEKSSNLQFGKTQISNQKNECDRETNNTTEKKSIRHKLRHLTRQQRLNLKSKIQKRRKKLQKILSDPVVVMTMDKFSFVFGVLNIMIIELVLLVAPDRMGILYTVLLVPLMMARYVIYRADLYHYFMYDFCYFSQIMMLVHMYAYPDNERLVKALFAISNGPLAMAVVLWRNSLVFHSMDKMTSMFIHVLPPLVTFCHRWEDHLLKKQFPFYEAFEDSWTANIVDFWLNPFCYYVLWQIIYLFKTEIISKRKLRYNTEIMTSLRWLTRKPDSTSYKVLSVFGERNQLPTFVSIQAVYTMVTYLIVPLLWHSFWLHSVYLLGIFIVALVNGAKYYFHVFAVRYIEEIGKKVEEERSAESRKDENDTVEE